MRWAHFWILVAVAGCLGSEDETDKLSNPPPPISLDSNLRRALLKALTELENEENEKQASLEHSDKIVTKASAAAVSIVTNPERKLELESPPKTETDEIVVQKSNGVQSKLITTIENVELDPIGEAEQFLTSASSSFTSPNNKVLHEKNEPQLKNSLDDNQNSLSDKTTVATQRPIIKTTTPTTTTTSTEENEAKVEDVQFFSAPLVAAFTVHQDERGLPKHVEPIYKPTTSTIRKPTAVEQKIFEQAKLRQDAIIKQQLVDQQRIRNQFEIQEKQKALETEIQRLKAIQQQQDLYLRKQLQKEKLLEEEIRLRDSGLPFNTIRKQQLTNQIVASNIPTIEPKSSIKPEKAASEPKDKTNSNSVSLQPSITFDPLVEAGKLPPNGQILPVKNANNFHAPIIQTPSFQQFHSLSQPNLATIRNFQPLIFEQSNLPDITFTTPSSLRVFRQESDTGNFFNTNNNNLGSSFSIQKSIQPPQLQQSTFFRSNFESPFSSIQPESQFQFNNFQPVQQNRFFRSPNNYHQQAINPQAVDRHLNHLLYNSGIIKGNEQEHFGIISKVLSLNHDNSYANSNIVPNNVQPPTLK